VLVAAAAVVVVAVAAVVVFTSGAFGGSGGNGSSSDNAYPTSLATVHRRDLSSQTQVNATLGYAGSTTIVAPGGTAPSAVQQAAQAVTTATAQLGTARTSAAADGGTLTAARATLAADRAKLAVDCAGDSAGQAPASGVGGSGGSGSDTGACSTDQQAVTADEQAVTQAESKVQADSQAVSSAESGLAGARSALAQAQSSATLYGASSTYTALPAVGAIVERGDALYSVSGEPVILLYGTVAAWRSFAPGMSPGRDVAELNANLRALGLGSALAGDVFTGGTESAIEALQAAHGAARTGTLPLGAVVFEPGAVRVTSVTPTVGATVQPGAVLGVTSTRRVVTIALDAGEQTSVKVGDPVEITLPDQSTTPGKVSYVGTVATTPSSDQGNGNGDTSPTIEVDVTPTDPKATGRLDQAPVLVAITTASVRNALVVPVASLLALASGGYALEVAQPGGAHRLEAVELGIFDDSDGLVQVRGSAVVPGQRVVVPGE
jgi:hypothetical protein